jgi:hypothetical protein
VKDLPRFLPYFDGCPPMFVARPFSTLKSRSLPLRLVLVICAWQGPLPYWHAHSTAVDVAEGSPSLCEHLRLWHGSADAGSAECSCGHWHFEYPHAPDEGEPGSHPGKDRLATLAAAGAQIAAPDAATFDVSPLQVIETGRSDSGRLDAPGRNTATHFFDGFAPSLSSPLRFGVLRC